MVIFFILVCYFSFISCAEFLFLFFLQSHPNAKDYRYAPVPLYGKLSQAFGKDRANGKEAAPPADNVDEIDKEEEENIDEEIGVEITRSSSINQSQAKKKCDDMEIQPKKRIRGTNLLAHSITELGKDLGSMINKSSEKLCEAANRLAVGMAVFDDSRNLINELKKMDLTEHESFAAADKILSVPHRLNIFWGSDEANRLAFIKSLID